MGSKWFTGLTLSLWLTASVSVSFGAAAINWKSDFDKALKTAAHEEKWVFLNFYTNSCPYCVKMDREVFAKPEVAQLISRFVPVKVNAESEAAVAARYQVTGFPSSFVLDSQGNILEIIPGFMPAERFVQKIGPAAEGKNPLKLLEEKAAGMPDSATVQLVVGYQFLERQHYARSRSYLTKGYDLASGQPGIREEGLRLIVASYLLGEDLEGAESWVERYEREFPESSFLGPMYFDLGQIYFQREAFERAASSFAKAKDTAEEFMLRVRANWMLKAAKEKLENPGSAPATE